MVDTSGGAGCFPTLADGWAVIGYWVLMAKVKVALTHYRGIRLIHGEIFGAFGGICENLFVDFMMVLINGSM